MTVQLGFGGQELIYGVLEKVRSLRQAFPSLDIQVDGGINSKTAALAVQAGANILVAGSAIFAALPDFWESRDSELPARNPCVVREAIRSLRE